MEGLSEQEQKFFESGGTSEVEETEKTEVVEEKVETTTQTQVQTEKKLPSKFEYSKDTDNVVDDLGRKYVPLGAVQEARNENKTLKRELDELKTKWTGGEQKLNALLERLQGPKEEVPAYDKDPLAHLKSKNQELEDKIKALSEVEEKRGKETEASNQIQDLQNKILAAERSFVSEKKDYAEAVGKVQEVWRAEYEAAGVPEQLIESMLARKGLQFSYAAMQKDQNPAEAVYKLAHRYGYKPAADESQKDKDKLKTIAKGQEAEKSLSSGKGAGDMSLEALATMSDEEMDEFVKDPKSWKKLSKAA